MNSSFWVRWTSLALGLATLLRSHAGILFPDPPGGWTYSYNGDKATAGAANSGFTSLDGTWSHDNGSDEWDGSAPGGVFGDGNRPGGVGTFEEAGLRFLRIQDPGDPRDFAFGDPGSNRKLYLGHDMSLNGASETQLDDGITLSFRARIPTPAKSTSPLDPLYRDGQGAAGAQPYPTDGDGYVTSDGGKGNFVLKQSSGGAIAFSLSTLNDTAGGDPNGARANFRGLTMNEFAGNAISGNVNFGQGTGTNVIAFDPTDWHEFWIVIRKDPANIGTHQAYIYLDGSLTPTVFRITAGNGSDYTGFSYLAIGSTATPQNSALDIDFVSYKLGVNFPPGFAEPAGGWTYTYNGDQATAGAANSGFTSLDGTWSHDNGSDEWDGSAPGGTLGDGNRPGGAGTFEEAGLKFLRIQDTGDPRDFAFADPGSNRKLYFGHDMSLNGATETQLDDGITLSFRARIPTPAKSTSPLDALHRDGQGAAGPQPYPANGDGYVTSDGGKGNFVLKQSSGGAIAFSLSTLDDTAGGDPNGAKANFRGLTMNEFAGNAVSGNVNFGQGTGTNVIAFDPTDWHTFWIVIRKDPANIGTHQGFIYLDGNFEPTVFKITAGNGSDYTGFSYLAIGSTATPQNSALDVDFVSYKLGAHFPGNAIDSLPPEIAEVKPAQNASFQTAAEGLSFSATTQGNNELNPSGFSLVLNGQDVSSSIALQGSPQARTARYSGLQPNTVYRGEIIVRDQFGRGPTNRVAFDTFVDGPSIVVEAEDYNFGGGQFVNNPTADALREQVGTQGVDYRDTTAAASGGSYRSGDGVLTASSADFLRAKYTELLLVETQVGGIQIGEWMNYTRNFPAGRYNVYVRAGSAGAQSLRLDRVTGNPTQPGQSLALEGLVNVPNTGSASAFTYGVLSDVAGNPVSLGLVGETTLRLTALGAVDNLSLNYLVLVPTSPPSEPQVVAVPGAAATGVSPAAPIVVTVLDGPTSVAPGSVRLFLDDTDVTSTTSVTDLPEGVGLRHVPARFFAGGSTHTLKVTYPGGERSWSFSVATLPSIPPWWSTPVSSVSGRPRGFAGRIHQAGEGADGNLLPNSVDRAIRQLAGQINSPLTGSPFENLAAGPDGQGGFTADLINFNELGTDEGMPGDLPFPNLEAGDQNYIAMQVNTFVDLPAGVHRLGVACDDGFIVYAGPSLTSTPLILGVRDPGGGTVPFAFDFVVEQAGVYALKLLFFEGSGGGDVEWYSEDPATGDRLLLNAEGSFRAFQTRSGDGSSVPPGPTVSGTPPAGFAGPVLTGLSVDAGTKTITADIPAGSEQGYLTITPAVVVKTVTVVGNKLVVTYE